MYSKYIENFLIFIKDVQVDYNVNIEEENRNNDETQDLLHTLELTNLTYHQKAKIANKLIEVRQERRDFKNKELIITPIVEWINDNQDVIKKLQKLLGEVRKIESKCDNSSYLYKTDIAKELLNIEEDLIEHQE